MELRGVELRAQKHTDFYSLAFFKSAACAAFAGEASAPFQDALLRHIDGRCLCHVEIFLEHVPALQEDKALAKIHFGGQRLIATHVSYQAATVWTPYKPTDDGRICFLIQEHSLTSCRAGRLVQRLLEIETYRMLALLPLPLAREVSREVRGIGKRFAEAIELLDNIGTPSEQEALLDQLTLLAMENERLVAKTNYRLHAGEAYYRIIQDRLRELQQERVLGFQTIGEFLDRRMVPAHRTCNSVRDRLERMSRRLNRAVDLLRTRINVVLEKQNQQMLESLDRRAKLQLQLQQTVEGISVVAISYYGISLIKILLKGLKNWGLHFDEDLAALFVLPIIVLLVWLGTRFVHHRIQPKP